MSLDRHLANLRRAVIAALVLVLTEAEDETIHAEAKKRVNIATDTVDAEPFPGVETIFDHVTGDSSRDGVGGSAS